MGLVEHLQDQAGSFCFEERVVVVGDGGALDVPRAVTSEEVLLQRLEPAVGQAALATSKLCALALSNNFSTNAPALSAGPSTPLDSSNGLGFSTFARHYSRNTFFSSGY